MATAAQLAAHGAGRCAIGGDLTLEAVPALWQQLQRTGLLASAREADLAGVTNADSAGLAMLVAWRGHCLAAGATLGFSNLPQRLLALARLTSAEAVLGA